MIVFVSTSDSMAGFAGFMQFQCVNAYGGIGVIEIINIMAERQRIRIGIGNGGYRKKSKEQQE